MTKSQSYAKKVQQAAAAVRRDMPTPARVGLILGTGLAHIADRVEKPVARAFDDIPCFGQATALGHRGRLVSGLLCGVPLLILDGRLHRYEGYSASAVTLPVRVLHALGIETLIITNAAGGMNPCYRVGDIMLIRDHLDLAAQSPLLGIGDPLLGHPDEICVSEGRCETRCPYDDWLSAAAMSVARQHDIALHQGVYAGMIGPNYETRAEYRFLRRAGADAVGMSTVPEVIVAAHAGIRVLGLSTVTNVCLPDALTPTSGEAVISAAHGARCNMEALVCGVVERLREGR